MINSLFSNEAFNKFLIENAEFSNKLKNSPIGLIDVGARGGVSEIFKPASNVLNVLGFEPDPIEVARIIENKDENLKWASLKIMPIAVSSQKGTEQINVLRHSVNSSMYTVRDDVYSRYKLNGFELDKKITIDVTTIDDLVFSNELKDKNYGEILKIDTQGAELKILKGAERTLKERTCCILCEAAFFTPYENVSLFSELEIYLRKIGFTFYGFLDFQHRSTKMVDKVGKIGRERSMQADALFFKDPLENNFSKQSEVAEKFEGRGDALIIAALLFGYYDFAAEMVEIFIENKQKKIMHAAINSLASTTAKNAVSNCSDYLEKIRENGFEDKVLSIGKLVDMLRDYHTFHDIKK